MKRYKEALNGQNAQERYVTEYLFMRYQDEQEAIDDDCIEFVTQLRDWRIQGEENICSNSLNISNKTLTNFLTRSHRFYLEVKLPEIAQHLLIHAQREDSSLTAQLVMAYQVLKERLENHFAYEEKKLFPFLLDGKDWGQSSLMSQGLEIERYMLEHTDTHVELQVMIESIDHHMTKQGMCSMVLRVLQRRLELLQNELVFHELLEDQILLPRLIGQNRLKHG